MISHQDRKVSFVTKRIESSIPFVGLHAHSGLSPFDGLGMPGEHMDFAFENGMNAHALTDQFLEDNGHSLFLGLVGKAL